MSSIKKIRAAALGLTYPLALATLTAAPATANADTVKVQSAALVDSYTAEITGGSFTNLDVDASPLAFTITNDQTPSISQTIYVLCGDLNHEQTIAALTNEVRTLGTLTNDFSLGNGAGIALTPTQIGISGGLADELNIIMSAKAPDYLKAFATQAVEWTDILGATNLQLNNVTADQGSAFEADETEVLNYATAHPDSNVITYNKYDTGEQSFFGTVSALLTSAVPEPASWEMMIVGVGAVGASMRIKRFKALSNSARLAKLAA